jgi:hypothetical protein
MRASSWPLGLSFNEQAFAKDNNNDNVQDNMIEQRHELVAKLVIDYVGE